MPFSEKSAQGITAGHQERHCEPGFRTGLWVRMGESFINIATATPDARFSASAFYSFGEDSALESVTEARGELPGSRTAGLLSEVVATRLVGDKATVERQDSLWRSAVTPGLAVGPHGSAGKNVAYGLQLHAPLAENRQKTERYDIAFWKKLIYPLASLVMVALALPFAYSHNRVGGVSPQDLRRDDRHTVPHAQWPVFPAWGSSMHGRFSPAPRRPRHLPGCRHGHAWWVERR